jgi:hypothetical protein
MTFFLKSLTVFAAAAAIALATGGAPAEARDTARRCDWNGCNYIHCNATGDRCFRVDEDRDGNRIYRGYYGYGDDEGDRYSGGRRQDRYSDGSDRRSGSRYYRPRHKYGRDRDRDRSYEGRYGDYLDAPYNPDNRYQDRYRYDDRW